MKPNDPTAPWRTTHGEFQVGELLLTALTEWNFTDTSEETSDCPSFERSLAEDKTLVLVVDSPNPQSRCSRQRRYNLFLEYNWQLPDCHGRATLLVADSECDLTEMLSMIIQSQTARK